MLNWRVGMAPEGRSGGSVPTRTLLGLPLLGVLTPTSIDVTFISSSSSPSPSTSITHGVLSLCGFIGIVSTFSAKVTLSDMTIAPVLASKS